MCKLNSSNDHFKFVRTGIRSESQLTNSDGALQHPAHAVKGVDMEPAPRRSRETHHGTG